MATTSERDTRGPGWLPTALVITGTVLAIVGALTTWVRTQALDTDAWVATSSELLAEPDVQAALADYLVDELFAAVDVSAELEEALPDQLDGLAGPVAGALREPATTAVRDLVGTPRFGEAWARANRVTHEAVVAVLRGESTTALSTADGTITLNLGDLLVEVGGDLGLSDDALDRIPPDAGQVVLVQSDRLATAQQAVRVLEALSWFLFLLVVGSYALAVYLSPGRRREALGRVGVGLLVAGVTLVLVRAIGIRTTVDLVVVDAGNQPVAAAVGRIGTQLLGQIGWAEVLYGVLFVAFAALLGPSRWATTVRRALGRWSESTGAIVAGTVLAIVALAWWSPGRAFDHWATALLLVGLAVGAVGMLVAQLRDEFPPDVPVRPGEAGSDDPQPPAAA